MRLVSLKVIAVAIACAIVPGAVQAQQAERNIMASAGGGTQKAIARDIATLGARCKMPLNVVGTKGSLENFFGVRNRHNTQFGIVDSDILNYLHAYEGTNKDVKAAVQGMRIMLPLFDAEVHVVAPKSVKSLQDLRGKRLGVGDKFGSAYLTSQMMFDLLRIKLAERVTGSGDDMVELLRQGEIDAMIRVGGAPLALFGDNRLDGDFHLVPITDELLHASYKPVTLAGGMYSFQPESVNTVAVKTLLMTYEYGSEKNQYYKNACKTVADFTSLIVENLNELRGDLYHPKWKTVNLTEIPKGWEVGACVRKGLDPTYEVGCSEPVQEEEISENQEYLNLLRERLHSR